MFSLVRVLVTILAFAGYGSCLQLKAAARATIVPEENLLSYNKTYRFTIKSTMNFDLEQIVIGELLRGCPGVNRVCIRVTQEADLFDQKLAVSDTIIVDSSNSGVGRAHAGTLQKLSSNEFKNSFVIRFDGKEVKYSADKGSFPFFKITYEEFEEAKTVEAKPKAVTAVPDEKKLNYGKTYSFTIQPSSDSQEEQVVIGKLIECPTAIIELTQGRKRGECIELTEGANLFSNKLEVSDIIRIYVQADVTLPAMDFVQLQSFAFENTLRLLNNKKEDYEYVINIHKRDNTGYKIPVTLRNPSELFKIKSWVQCFFGGRYGKVLALTNDLLVQCALWREAITFPAQ